MIDMRNGVSALAIASAFAAAAPAALAQEGEGRITTVTVTATKTEASAQDVPIAVQAVDAETLEELNVGNFDDYIRYLPNVSSGGRGPGQSTVYIRGMAVQPITVLLSGAQGTQPNVALYLDEQPVTAPGRNLDVFATDLERVEVLPGPQGTLFGASSQAGTIRLITNKPKLDVYEAGFDGEIATTAEGEESYGLEGYVNLPIVQDKLALRVAAYNIEEGGYIDNTPGTFTTDPTINPDSTATPNAVSYETADNQALGLVEENFNDSYYRGVRGGLKLALNDDWDVLVQHTHQKLGADGVFDYDPEVGDLEVNRFFPDSLEDEFDQTSWTVNGRMSALELVYTGAFLTREVNQSVDYTGYNNAGAFISYYTCTYDNPAYIVNYGIDPQFITPGGRECLTPVKGAVIDQDHERFTHEFRITTDQTAPVRLTAGVFYDHFEIETQDDYYYLATPALGFAPNAPMSGAVQINPATRPAGVAFFNDIRRTDEQIAFFGEVAADLTETITLNVGLRQYKIESDFEGSSNFAAGIFQGSVDTDGGRDYDVNGGHTPEPLETEGLVAKLNLSWKPSADRLFYATYSEGFRPGGWNRGGGIPSVNPSFPTVSATYDTDDVKNYELGWKTLVAGGNLQWNGNVYFIEWTDMQVSRFDPQNVSILTFIENAADSEILGLETDAVWAATDQLTLFGALSYNQTELTSVDAQIVELAPVGSELPLTPELQFNLRGRYEWALGGFDAHAQAGVQYASDSYSSLIAAVREEQDGYTTADASFGLARDGWAAELFVENLTDERAQLFINEQDDIRRITTNRPRTIGLRLSYDY